MELAMSGFYLRLLFACFSIVSITLPCRTHAQANPESIVIDPTAPAEPFPHFWEHLFGSGRAQLSLRESYRHDLLVVKDVTALRYIRFHGILLDEMACMRKMPKVIRSTTSLISIRSTMAFSKTAFARLWN